MEKQNSLTPQKERILYEIWKAWENEKINKLTCDNVLVVCSAGEEDPRTLKSVGCNCQAPKPAINLHYHPLPII